MNNTEALEVMSALQEASDYADQAGRPKVAEKTIMREVQPVLLNGGGTPRERSRVVVGIIQTRVCKAYGIAR